MDKQKIKAFVKDHKKEIIVGAGLSVIGIAAGVVGVKKVKTPKNNGEWPFVIMCPSEKDVDRWADLFGNISEFRNEGASLWMPMHGDKFTEIAGNNHVHDCDGRLFEVTGAILLGNPVTTE